MPSSRKTDPLITNVSSSQTFSLATAWREDSGVSRLG